MSRRSFSRSAANRPEMLKRVDVSSAQRGADGPTAAKANANAILERVNRRDMRLPLAGLEQLTLHQFVQQRAQAAVLFLGAGDHFAERRAVAEGDVAAGRIH